MTIKDRTSEFHSCADSLSQRSNIQKPLLSQNAVSSKSEFTKAAAQISREINSTLAKLHSLTRLAKKKTLFDDKPNEINDLVLGIKQDITLVNRQIALLQQHQRNQFQSQQQQKQATEHSSNVITSLQTKLASTSNEFKSILELRTQNMKDQKNRREQYTGSSSSSSNTSSTAPVAGYSVQGATGPPPSQFAAPPQQPQLFGIPTTSASNPLFSGDSSSLFNPSTSTTTNYSSPLYNPDRKFTTSFSNDSEDGLRNRGDHHQRGDSAVIDMGMGSHQQLVQQNNAATMEYIESRGQAIDSIESTIAELGQIYSQFTQILSQQREMVQRIDVNVMDTEVNVTNAHNELAKFLERLQGNRWLMIQVFGILVVFFMLFVVIS
ncbi:UNVERIFIED_CONTAM: cis-Golgi t-SNARE syntaxin [Siphonaria sp. JEL0065]|nr:cis-Golgi t-SNARE syntaxin [Siphonaria sp. JEL0065]